MLALKSEHSLRLDEWLKRFLAEGAFEEARSETEAASAVASMACRSLLSEQGIRKS